MDGWTGPRQIFRIDLGYWFYFQDQLVCVVSLCRYVPQCRGYEMPTYLTILSADVNSGQEGRALRFCLQEVFKHLGSIRPDATMIDKDPTEYNAFRDVINEDPMCWESGVIGGHQKQCHLLLRHFHAKGKEKRIEHLLSKIIMMQWRRCIQKNSRNARGQWRITF